MIALILVFIIIFLMMACDTTVHTVIQSGLLVWKETLNLVFLLSEFWAGSGGDQHREAACCTGYM